MKFKFNKSDDNIGFVAKEVPEFMKSWRENELGGERKISWIPAEEKLTLAARYNTYGVYESDMAPIEEWCEKNNCGKRIRFDQFLFQNEKEITMFVLRWS
jgi:hypothetical protein